jgi:uncharacterized membrane protein
MICGFHYVIRRLVGSYLPDGIRLLLLVVNLSVVRKLFSIMTFCLRKDHDEFRLVGFGVQVEQDTTQWLSWTLPGEEH